MQDEYPKKVAIIGPESTGKSELAKFLATKFDTCWVSEYARDYLERLGGPYNESDLLHIAQRQIREEDRLFSKAKRVLICDTNLIVIKIWSYIKYGRCDKAILDMMHSRHYDLHLLTWIDIPWEADLQREHPHRREEIWQVYKNELIEQAIPHVEIRGARQQRREKALGAIINLINTRHQ